MSLLPAYFGARKRDDDLAPPSDEPDDELRRQIFSLIPPRAANRGASLDDRAPPIETPAPQPVVEDEPKPARKPIGQNKHPVDMTDLSRLSIDGDGQLYWDGKPVKARRELAMSRRQVVAASLVTLVIVIGALGAAIQGYAAVHDLACKFGWTADHCALPAEPVNKLPRVDIPA